MPISLALFICGSLPDTLRQDPEYDGYAEVFSRFLQKSISNDTVFTLHAYDVVEKREYPPADNLDSYDGIILTGSGGCQCLLDPAGPNLCRTAASAYENVPWINELVKYIGNVVETKPQIRIIGTIAPVTNFSILTWSLVGICFGHQIIARALGGECIRRSWEVGPTILHLTDFGKTLLGVEEDTLVCSSRR